MTITRATIGAFCALLIGCGNGGPDTGGGSGGAGQGGNDVGGQGGNDVGGQGGSSAGGQGGNDSGAGGQGGSGAGGTGGQGGQVNHSLHLLTWAPPVSPLKPAVFMADLAVGAADYSFTLQPLDAEDRSTPVGSLTSHGPFPIEDSSPFSPTIPWLLIPGEANPLTSSELTVEDLVFDGSSSTPELICGVTEGAITSPIVLNMDGATFTLVPEEGGAFPEPPPIACDGTLADPL